MKKSIFSGNTLKRGISALLAVCTAAVLFLSPSMGMEAQAAGKGDLSSQACQLVDRKTIEYFGLEEKEYVYQDLIREIDEKMTSEMLADICRDCEWFPISACRKNICGNK